MFIVNFLIFLSFVGNPYKFHAKTLVCNIINVVIILIQHIKHILFMFLFFCNPESDESEFLVLSVFSFFDVNVNADDVIMNQIYKGRKYLTFSTFQLSSKI